MGNSSSSSSIQSYLHNKENQEQFIISMNSTSPLFSDSLNHSSIVQSQALSVSYFCFFTCGSNRNLKFWQLKNFFVISLQVKNPPITQFYAIVHTFNEAKFLSTHIDKVAYANMISFMDSVPASLSREAYISRILNLYKNNDPLLYSKVYPLYRIRVPQPILDIAEPTLLGRNAHRNAQDENFSTTVSDHPSRLEVNSEYLEVSSTINEVGSSLINAGSKNRQSGQANTSNRQVPELKSRQFDVWSSVVNDTTSFLDNDSEFNPNKSPPNNPINYANDIQTSSSFLNAITEPDSVDKDGLSTILDSQYTDYQADTIRHSELSSSFNSISEPGSYESSISQTFKEARKLKTKVHLHKHHNLDNEGSDDGAPYFLPSSSTVTVSESFFSPSTRMNSESSSRSSSRSHKRSRRRRRRYSNEEEEDDDNYSISYSDRSVAKRASKIHIFTDSNEDSMSQSSSSRRRSKSRNHGRDSSSAAPSFVSESVISSTTGQKSSKKRNVGIDVDLHHDVGFTTSETSQKTSQYEKDERSRSSSSLSNGRSNRSNKGGRSRRRNDNYNDDNESENRIKNRKKDISMDLSKSQVDTIIESD